MFKLFRKKSDFEILDKQYRKLLKEAHNLSKINRRASDEKLAEADLIVKQMEKLESA
ncbi:MAG: Lacal_2735 family protein [Bacteroidales bacterium]|nr:Lacal_2735 family protein [Bacteroidales bacterium]MCF8455789.1 Lacal_2735 family protein [Bacteroidales bacterium]